jgi:phosphate transport system permease protein
MSALSRRPASSGGLARRKLTDRVMMGVFISCMAATLVPLALVFGYSLFRGLTSIDLDFFIREPKPLGEAGGGMGQAIMGTFILVGIAAVIAVPAGIGLGIYLSEMGENPLGTAVRFLLDVLTGIPSIVIGLFAFTILVLPFKSFSAWAGGAALAIIMLPIVGRTAEEMLRLIPGGVRESSLALGVSQWRTTLRVMVPAALPGIVTGALLGMARAAGETAPLLFTALGNRFFTTDLSGPMGALPLQIYAFAKGPYDDEHRLAWAGALVLISLIAIVSAAVRMVTRGRSGR